MAKFDVFRRADGDYHFNLVADNNEVILTSEGYQSLYGCANGIQSVRENARREDAFHRLTSGNGKAYFNLRSANNQVVGTSQMYESAGAMEKGIKSVRVNAPNAEEEFVDAFS